jgi:murein DD-endopeptidase MepM/ murein hydrolase activator NlpD
MERVVAEHRDNDVALTHNRSRRLMGACLAMSACAALLLSGGHRTHAADPDVLAQSATATASAVRLRQSGSIPFPMSPRPRCEVLDNFGDARSGGRSHEGVDILATLGQPVVAVADGTLITQYTAGGASSSLSGSAWKLAGDDGNRYFFAHMSAFAAELSVGTRVSKGQVIGYVGDTGNPGSGNFHLHFEFQPSGGQPVNSLPMLQIPYPCRVY